MQKILSFTNSFLFSFGMYNENKKETNDNAITKTRLNTL